MTVQGDPPRPPGARAAPRAHRRDEADNAASPEETAARAASLAPADAPPPSPPDPFAPTPRGPLGRALDRLYLASGVLAAAFLVVIFALMLVLAVGREVKINVPSGDDFAAWSMAALAFLGLAHTFRSGEMIRVGLLVERLRGGPKRAAELFALTIALLFVGFFAWHAAHLAYDSWRFDDISQGVVAVPLWIPQLSLGFGLALLLVAILDEMHHVARFGRLSFEKPPPRTADEVVARAAESGGV